MNVPRIAIAVLMGLAGLCCVGQSIEVLKPDVTQVAPGVFRVRAGEPEKIVPSMVRQAPKEEALAAMPKVDEIPLKGIKIWRMTRGCRIELPLGNAELIYGLGLQCKHLEQNGWRRTLYTASGDDNGAGMSHAPVPFYVSTAGYGVLVDSARCLTFSVSEKQRLADVNSLAAEGGKQQNITDVAALYGPEKRDKTSVYVDVPAAGGVDVYLFAGPRMGEAVARYNLFSGGGCLPSLAGLGPEYLIGTMLESKAALETCERFKLDRMPVTSVGMEPCWQTHAYSSSYLWNREKFPEGFVETVRTLGYELTLWCQLYIDPSSPLIPLLGKRFGDFEVWNGLVPDVADPKAQEIYGNFLAANFIRHGVAGFKLDEVDGSPKPSGVYQNWMFPDFASFPSGADGDQLRNLLGRLGVQAISDAFRKENRRTFGLVRATQAWSSPMSVAVYSDEYNFNDYLRYNLSAGVQGLLWSPEVRHADNERDWARRVAAAAFSAKMVYNDWQFPHPAWKQPNLSANEHGDLLPDDNPYIRTARRFSNLRMALLPYLYQAYGDYHRKGIAPIRPLVADWPEDGNTWHLEDQWMFGADLLVAPLTEANSFSSYTSLVVADANKFRSLNGSCQITKEGDTIELAMDFDGLGIKGVKTPLELQAGPCTMRFTYRADAGNAGIRLWTPDGKELREFHLDELPSGRGWQTGVVRATLPKAGTYSLYIGKAHASNGARHIAFRNITVIQKPQHQDVKTAWNREVYLPEGRWRDFWTGAVVAGGQWQVVTATPEHPPVFVRDNTLLPLAEPLVTLNDKSVFTIHLAAYGDNPRPCQLLEDDGTTFDYDTGKWATLTVKADGSVDRPDQGQPQRYNMAGKAQPPESVLKLLLDGK
ncbi:MAG: TIM-barrel domain-containing protein [bacterium]